ncbi:MAG: ClC family H(+)/Cl(-) exchange transporter [Candidatus Humimicrobiaceae bacterium]
MKRYTIAGLAAAFNAPLAGVIFALEEIHKSFSSLILLSAVSSSVTADFIASGFFGLKPIFNFKSIKALPLKSYPYLLVVGTVIGLFGALFNYSLLKVKDLYVRQKFIPIIFRPVIPLLFAGILGFFYPQVLGGGNTLVTSLTQNNFGIKLLFILLVLKFSFTILSYGSGAPGGIFLPLLAVGAITGNLLGIFFSHIFNLNSIYINNFIILAMAGYFAAIVKAPITGIVLITEMTGSFSHLLSLSIVVFTSYSFANLVGSKPIYESLLQRSLQNEEYGAFVGEAKTKVVLEVPILIESNIEGQKIKDICWPQGCLLVGIRRGAEEIIPKGETIIYPGDYLVVLTNENEVNEVMKKISEFSEGSKIKTYYQYELFFHKVVRFFKKIFKALIKNQSNLKKR